MKIKCRLGFIIDKQMANLDGRSLNLIFEALNDALLLPGLVSEILDVALLE